MSERHELPGDLSVEFEGDVMVLIKGDQRIRLGPEETARLRRKIERSLRSGKPFHMGVLPPEDE